MSPEATLLLLLHTLFYSTVFGVPTQPITFVNSTAYTVQSTDAIIWINSTLGVVNVTLPPSASVPGNSFTLMDGGNQASVNNIVIYPDGSDNFLRAGPGEP